MSWIDILSEGLLSKRPQKQMFVKICRKGTFVHCCLELSIEKRMHNIRAASSVLFGSLLRTIVWDTTFQMLWATTPKRWWRRYIYIYIYMVYVYVISAHISVEGCCWSQGAHVSVNYFNAFLGMRRCKKLGSSDFLLKISHYLQTCSASFP